MGIMTEITLPLLHRGMHVAITKNTLMTVGTHAFRQRNRISALHMLLPNVQVAGLTLYITRMNVFAAFKGAMTFTGGTALLGH